MFRKSLLPILCAATFSAAIPLKMGESWVWQLTNRDNLDLTWRSAVVVDSQRIPEGNVWSLVARDSSLKESDTAKILVRPNGRQNWLRQSRFLNWELEPRRAEDTMVVMLTSEASSVWGEASSLEPVNRGRRFSDLGRSLVSVDSNSVDWSNAPDLVSTPLPLHVWSDSLGMEQALTFWGTVRGWDWRLVSHNGQVVNPPQDVWKIPALHTEITWIKKSFQQVEINIDLIALPRIDSMEKIRWRILDQGLDSAGWKTVSILQTFQLCFAMVSNAADSPDTACREVSNDTLPFRIHPGRGQVFGVASSFPILLEGWTLRWEDALQAGPDLVANRSWSRSNSVYQSSQSNHSFRRDGQLVSYSNLFSSGFKNSSLGGMTYTSPSGTTIRLVGVLSPGSSVRRTSSPALATLDQVASRHPSLPIRWSTASGRTGTLAASEIVQRPAALRGKTVFLQARLPDGRTWQRTHVVP